MFTCIYQLSYQSIQPNPITITTLMKCLHNLDHAHIYNLETIQLIPVATKLSSDHMASKSIKELGQALARGKIKRGRKNALVRLGTIKHYEGHGQPPSCVNLEMAMYEPDPRVLRLESHRRPPAARHRHRVPLRRVD